MNKDILHLRLAMESKRWDEMVDRIEQYYFPEGKEGSCIQKKKETFDEYLKKLNEKQNQIYADADKNEEIVFKKQKNSVKFDDDNFERQKFNFDETEKKKQSIKKVKIRQEELDKQFENIKGCGINNFDEEEHELISCAFKNHLKEVRNAITNLDILLGKEKFNSKQQNLDQYKNGLRYDLIKRGERQIKMLQQCEKLASSPISLIKFLKQQADIFRYLAEHTIGQDRVSYKEKADILYNEGIHIVKRYTEYRVFSQNQSDIIDQVRLALYLNYAIFLYEIVQNKKEALRVLKKQIQEALDDFEKWNPDELEQIKHQVRLIQENINIWKQEVDTDSEEEN